MTARCQTESVNPRHVMLELRHAFDEQNVVVKNLMLRKAHDCIEQLLGVAQAPAQSQVDAAAAYLVSTIERKLWSGIRSDGRSQDSGFVPFHTAQFSYAVNSNARQEDYRDVVREISRILSVPSASGGDVAASPWRKILEAIDHTLTVHGHIDRDTILHLRVKEAICDDWIASLVTSADRGSVE